MARYRLASEGVGVYQDSNGNAVADVPFVLTGGGLYAATTGGTAQATLTTDSKGRARGYLDEEEPGVYTISYAGGEALEFAVSGAGAEEARLNALESDQAEKAPYVAVLRESPLNIDWPEYASLVSGDDWSPALDAALAAMPAEGGEILIPRRSTVREFGSPLVLADGVCIAGEGIPNRFRSTDAAAVKLRYTGTGQAVLVATASGEIRESTGLRGLQIDGDGLSGAVDGLLIDGTDGLVIEGLVFEKVAFTNFPRHQVLIDGLVFDITFDRLSVHNRDNISTNELVKLQQTRVSGGYVGQISFHEPWMLNAGAGWCFNGEGPNCGDVRFFGGTVAGEHADTSGIRHAAGLFIYGTHIEGQPGVGAGGGGVGIRYTGAQAAMLQPGFCADWGTGVQIGDPDNPGDRANGGVIGGVIGGNGLDIHLVAGGQRGGTIILATGVITGSNPTIQDDRQTVDGTCELTDLSRGVFPYISLGMIPAVLVPNNSVFRDAADGVLKKKNAAGVSSAL